MKTAIQILKTTLHCKHTTCIVNIIIDTIKVRRIIKELIISDDIAIN